MEDITGLYTGSWSVKGNLQTIPEPEVKFSKRSNNIIAIELTQNGDTFKLIAVSHTENDIKNLYIADKYTEQYLIKGKSLPGTDKPGLHGIVANSGSLSFTIVISEYNGDPVELNFEGNKSEGLSGSGELRKFNIRMMF